LNQIVNALQSDQNRTYYHEQYWLGAWTFDQIGPRVAFAGDAQLFLTNYFAHATVGDQEYTLELAATAVTQ
jgi:hypothetical protein